MKYLGKGMWLLNEEYIHEVEVTDMPCKGGKKKPKKRGKRK
jgi:hypothetical protein